MSVKAKYQRRINTVFSEDELRELRETLGWLKAAESRTLSHHIEHQ